MFFFREAKTKDFFNKFLELTGRNFTTARASVPATTGAQRSGAMQWRSAAAPCNGYSNSAPMRFNFITFHCNLSKNR